MQEQHMQEQATTDRQPQKLKLPAAIDCSKIRENLYRIGVESASEDQHTAVINEPEKQVLAGVINLWHSNFGKSVDDLQKVKLGTLIRESAKASYCDRLCNIGYLLKNEGSYQPTISGLIFALEDSFTLAKLSPEARLIKIDNGAKQIDHNGIHSALYALSNLPTMPAQQCFDLLKDLLGWDGIDVRYMLKVLNARNFIEITGAKSEIELSINQTGKNYLQSLNQIYKNNSALKTRHDVSIRKEVLSAVAFMCQEFKLQEGVSSYEISALVKSGSGAEVTDYNIEALARAGFLIQTYYTPSQVARLSKSNNLYRLPEGHTHEIIREYKLSPDLSAALRNVQDDEVAVTIRGKKIHLKIHDIEAGLNQHAQDKSDITTRDIKTVLKKLIADCDEKSLLAPAISMKDKLISLGILVLQGNRNLHKRRFMLRETQD